MTDHKFTDEEVIKTIECCLKAKTRGDCEKMRCPAFNKEGCIYYLQADGTDEMDSFIEMLKFALDLINRQKAEIAELEAECERQYEQAEADIRANLADGGTSCHWCIEGHRAEVANEFIDACDKMLSTICAATGLDMTYFGKYAVLKKKYTEGK